VEEEGIDRDLCQRPQLSRLGSQERPGPHAHVAENRSFSSASLPG
jgi:hypothetical protein